MKKQLLFLFLFVSLSAFGQKNFRSGYIIKQPGDTTFGEVAYRNNKTSALITHFRVDKKQSIETYSPDNLIGFGYIDDKSMQSKTLGFVDNQAYKVFVEIIFKGKISLYRYKNDYIFEKENTLYLITNRELVELNPGEKTLVYSDDDVRTIANLVAECNQAIVDHGSFKIVDKYLVEILKIYHECINSDYQVFKENKPWTKIRFGIFGGSNSSKIVFTTNHTNDFLAEANFSSARSLFFGLEVNISSPRVTDAYELISGFQLMKTNYYGLTLIETQTGIERSDVWINLDKFTIPLGVRYNFSKKTIAPYLGFGVNFTSHSTFSFDRITELVDNGLIVGQENSIPFFPKARQVGLWGVLGINMNLKSRLTGFLEIKLERSNGVVKTAILQNSRLNDSISNIQLLLGIRF